jgi:hypothetical protein
MSDTMPASSSVRGLPQLAHIVRAGHEWTLKPHRLPLRLGDVTLGSVTMPAAILETPVEVLDLDPQSLLERVAADWPNAPDAVVLPSHPVDAATQPRVARCGGRLTYCSAAQPHMLVDLPADGSWRAQLPRTRRKELDRKRRRFAEQFGAPSLSVHSGRDGVLGFLRDNAALTSRTWQARVMRAGIGQVPGELEAILARAEDGDAFIFALRGDASPRTLAFGYCERLGDRAAYRHTGYDPEVRQGSPGIILLDLMLDALSARGIRLLDLGRGSAQYKADVATRSIPSARIWAYPDDWRGAVLIHGWRFNESFAEQVGRLLGRAGLKDRLRRALRR